MLAETMNGETRVVRHAKCAASDATINPYLTLKRKTVSHRGTDRTAGSNLSTDDLCSFLPAVSTLRRPHSAFEKLFDTTLELALFLLALAQAFVKIAGRYARSDVPEGKPDPVGLSPDHLCEE